MRFCTNCNRITTGDALFCNICGRSYDLRFCPRLHPNPRAAQVCSQCGSRELSNPQPKPDLLGYSAEFLSRILPGIVLVVVTGFFGFALFEALISARDVILPLLARAGALLIVGWVVYLVLPAFLQSVVRAIGKSLFNSGKHGSDHKRTGSGHR